LYDAKTSKLVHTILNEKIRTNALALVQGGESFILCLVATFDPSLSVLKCACRDGAWEFERAPQIKTGQAEELTDVFASKAGLLITSKDGLCHAFSAAEQYTLSRWKAPFSSLGRLKLSPCGKFVVSVSGQRCSFWNKQLVEQALNLPWSAADFWFVESTHILLTVPGDANVYKIENPLFK